MIRAFYGLTRNPLDLRDFELLPQQQEIHDTLKVHCQQGGLCLVLGVPGTGKSVVKQALQRLPENQHLVATVARTLHSYLNTVKTLCDAFRIEFEASAFKCERKLIEHGLEARITLRMQNFLVLASIVATTDMVAIVPHSVGSQLSQHNDVKLLPLPNSIPAFDVRQCWQERFHDDQGNRWLRQQFMELFSASKVGAPQGLPSVAGGTAVLQSDCDAGPD